MSIYQCCGSCPIFTGSGFADPVLEKSDPAMRYRRQAPPSPAGGSAALTGKQNRVGLTVQKGSRKWTFKKQYSAFAATMVNSTLAKKNVPQVRDYFQDIWKPADSWNWEMTPAAGASASGPYVTKITVPPFCKIFFNDVSVLQALGFDLVGVRDNASSVQIKLDRDGGPPTYFFENTGNAAKIFASTRFKFPCPIPSHQHELTQCMKFFSMTLRERQEECRNRICQSCFKPGGTCLLRGTKLCNMTVPKQMLCPGCVGFAKVKKITPNNLLFCASKHPAHTKPVMSVMHKVLCHYFGELGRKVMEDLIQYRAFSCTGVEAMAGMDSTSGMGDPGYEDKGGSHGSPRTDHQRLHP